MPLKLLAIVVLAYALLLLALRVGESRLVYFPGAGRSLGLPPTELGLPVERVEFPTRDGVTLVAWAMPAAPADAVGHWLLICHGNAGNISESGRPRHYAALRQLGLSVLAFDYRGYGESDGNPAEAGLYLDAEAAYRYLREERGVPAERIVVFGHSLGSAVAVDLAARLPVAGLIVEGALTSVVDRGQELYPWVPVRWLAASRFASLDKIERIGVPKLFLHATTDDVIPLAHGRRLYERAAEPKTFVELGGGHGDAFEVDSARYFDAIRRFIILPPSH